MGVKFIYGDLLKIRDVDAIVHQVNCLCVKAQGLSKQIAEKFPWYIFTVTLLHQYFVFNLVAIPSRFHLLGGY